MTRVGSQFPRSAPSRGVLIVGAGLCLFGGLGCAVGLAVTDTGEDVAQVVYLAGAVLAATGLITIGFLADRRRRAVAGARWRSRELTRIVQQISDINDELRRSDAVDPEVIKRNAWLLNELSEKAEAELADAGSDVLLLVEGGFIAEAETLAHVVEILERPKREWHQ